MHGRHDDDHLSHTNGESLDLPKPGHNRREDGSVAQWQTPHISAKSHTAQANSDPDIDLVELAFLRALAAAPDPTSFLRVAQIPFEARTSNGTRLVLLRIETESITDVGSVMPHLGGGSFHYHPLPGRMATRRERLRFVYFDGREPQVLTLALVRGLRPIQSEVD
jgi:hypothetical protein